MAILKLQLNVPVEASLKFAKGKPFESKFPGNEGQLMYTLTSGECVFLPLEADEIFASRHIGVNEPFVMCMRKTSRGAKYLEVHKLSDAAEPDEPQLDPTRYPDENGNVARPSKLERDLTASIQQAQQRKAASSSKSTPPSAGTASTQGPTPQNNPIAIVPAPEKPRAGSLMASALVAAVDAIAIAQEYAKSKDMAITFNAEDVRAIAATLYIQHGKEHSQYGRQGVR